ncbi:MAG: hypothetical protein ABMB14_34120, partial [Myxococcota bacterium]
MLGALPWLIDGTSLSTNGGRWPVRAAADCADRDDHTLGVALVVYSRKQGTMAWGHASLRTVSCADGAVVDLEYETYRMSRWNAQMLRDEHAGEPFLDDAGYLDRLRGALVLFRNVDPVDRGWFGEAEAHNREVLELWLDRPQDELDAIAAAADRWYATQRDTLRARAPLDARYRPLSTNCTTVFQRLLGVDDPPTMPFAWLRAEADDAQLRVLHPSHALVRRWDGLPTEVQR